MQYRIAGFCRDDFNVASHGIRNIKIRYIFNLVTFYHVKFCDCLVLCRFQYFAWGLFQTLKGSNVIPSAAINSANSK